MKMEQLNRYAIDFILERACILKFSWLRKHCHVYDWLANPVAGFLVYYMSNHASRLRSLTHFKPVSLFHVIFIILWFVLVHTSVTVTNNIQLWVLWVGINSKRTGKDRKGTLTLSHQNQINGAQMHQWPLAPTPNKQPPPLSYEEQWTQHRPRSKPTFTPKLSPPPSKAPTTV